MGLAHTSFQPLARELLLLLCYYICAGNVLVQPRNHIPRQFSSVFLLEKGTIGIIHLLTGVDYLIIIFCFLILLLGRDPYWPCEGLQQMEINMSLKRTSIIIPCVLVLARIYTDLIPFIIAVFFFKEKLVNVISCNWSHIRCCCGWSWGCGIAGGYWPFWTWV